jgi:Helix-turn-helix domain
MRKQRRLTDNERETIQLLRQFGPLNISQTARAMKCSRTTVRYWQAMKAGVNGPEFVRPAGIFA